MEYILGALALLSFGLNGFLVYLLKANRKKKPLSISAQEILGDLMRGQALVRIDRIAPEDVLLRSPRS